MANGAVTFEEVFTKAGIIPQWIERGIEKGIERGKEKKALEIAKGLLKKGWTVEETAELTKVPAEKVRSLLSTPSP